MVPSHVKLPYILIKSQCCHVADKGTVRVVQDHSCSILFYTRRANKKFAIVEGQALSDNCYRVRVDLLYTKEFTIVTINSNN